MTKRLNEVQPGDILYCIAFNVDGKAVSIIEITAKEIVTNGPDIDRHIYSKEAIIIKEKVPNTQESEGEFVIDQYYRGDECATCAYGIYTTFDEAVEGAREWINQRWTYYNKEEEKLKKVKQSIFESSLALGHQIQEHKIDES